MRRYYRRLSQKQKELIVHLRYGSRTHFYRVVRTIADVSKRLGVPYMTVKSALRRFIQAGHRWENLKMGVPPKIIPDNVRDTILSQEWLQTNAAYSLRERKFIIERDMGYKIGHDRLHKFFHANGVRFRQTRWVYRQAYENQPWKSRQRIDYAKLLANVMLSGRHELLFFDESR